MREEFAQLTKKVVAGRAAYRCSNPRCAAVTTGPQIDPNKSLNVGVASHIAAASPGGPRYDPHMSSDDRSSANNAIWLCQTCAKLIDNDPSRFSIAVLRQWKRETEEAALAAIGRTTSPEPRSRQHEREREIRTDLRTRDKLRAILLRPPNERAPTTRFPRPFDKFRVHKLVVRSLDDRSYPSPDLKPTGRMSSWLEFEPYDFYHGGLEVILAIRAVIIDSDGRWTYIEDGVSFDKATYRWAKAWVIGRIPWRNIRLIDPEGDSDNPRPQLHCAFTNDGTPYEEIRAAEMGTDYDWPLEGSQRLPESAAGTR